MVRTLTFHTKPRDTPLRDVPINFPEYDPAELYLHMMENKKKLKPNLPLLPPPPRRPISKIVKYTKERDEDVIIERPHQGQPVHSERGDNSNRRSERRLKRKEKRRAEIKFEEHDDIVLDQLAEDGQEEEIRAARHDYLPDDEDIDEQDVEEEEEDEYAHLPPEEREHAEKKDLLWGFRKLKKKYKNSTVPIPEFSEHSDLRTMRTAYEQTVQEINIDVNVEQYRTYLMGGSMAMELCAGTLGFDLTGFTAHQNSILDKYNHLLVELGEKNSSTWMSNLPVEFRLLGMILIQAAFFYAAKLAEKKYGSDAAAALRTFTGQPVKPAEEEKTSPSQKRKKKMRGPTRRKRVDISSEFSSDED